MKDRSLPVWKHQSAVSFTQDHHKMGRIIVDVLMNMKAVNCISNGSTSEGIWHYHRFNPVGLWTELMHMQARMCFRLSIFGAVELLYCIYWFFRWATRLTVRNFYLERFFATCIRCFCWGYLQEANWRYGEQNVHTVLLSVCCRKHFGNPRNHQLWSTFSCQKAEFIFLSGNEEEISQVYTS